MKSWMWKFQLATRILRTYEGGDQFLPLNVDVIPLVLSADPLDRNREIQLSRKDISMIRSSAWIVHRLCDCEGMDHFHFAQV